MPPFFETKSRVHWKADADFPIVYSSVRFMRIISICVEVSWHITRGFAAIGCRKRIICGTKMCFSASTGGTLIHQGGGFSTANTDRLHKSCRMPETQKVCLSTTLNGGNSNCRDDATGSLSTTATQLPKNPAIEENDVTCPPYSVISY